MIRVLNLSKSYGSNVLLDDVNFVMNPGERLGLIGRNGHGKTTLFRLLLGTERPDGGEIVVPRHYRIAHLSQHVEFSQDSVLSEACGALSKSEDGTDLSYRAEAALHGLGFEGELLQRSPEKLSGAYQVRLNLAKVLVSEPNLLLLDEPTNYLDIVSMRWLQRFLRAWRGEMILITHHREFMDQVTTHTMAIHRCKLRKVEGTTHKVFAQIAQEEEIHEKTRLNQERDRRQQERFIQRFRAKATKARAVQSRIKQLEKMETLERLDEIHDLNFRFHAAPFSAKKIMEVEGLAFHYPDGPTLMKGLNFRVGAKDRIAVIGPNGRGKTTLLSLLAHVLQPVTGKIQLHPKAQVAYYGQNNVERLDPDKTIEEEILSAHPDHSRGAARKICGLMLFPGDDALKKVQVLSGGEKSRVLLGKLLVSPANLLILDEPTNHLDMQSTEGLMHALEVFEGVVVLVTHSELILRRVANRLIVFDGGQSRVFEGGYQDFLERVGWREEQKAQNEVAKQTPERGRSRRELRRLRAEIIAERSKRLKPLKTRIERVEKEMAAREEEAKQVEALLCKAATEGETESISKLVQRSSVLRPEIQNLFEELEELMNEHDRLKPEFEKRLAELE
ncbi:ATP-binding cassette domain-containing protein [Acidobacteria bacterium AH-259-G07]|nr:ATP-binding cassette domain-containing protein [Acidobacteria bacterium AH-259-G07]